MPAITRADTEIDLTRHRPQKRESPNSWNLISQGKNMVRAGVLDALSSKITEGLTSAYVDSIKAKSMCSLPIFG